MLVGVKKMEQTVSDNVSAAYRQRKMRSQKVSVSQVLSGISGMELFHSGQSVFVLFP